MKLYSLWNEYTVSGQSYDSVAIIAKQLMDSFVVAAQKRILGIYTANTEYHALTSY